jgi:Ca2+-binding RTX toxin-like protein
MVHAVVDALEPRVLMSLVPFVGPVVSADDSAVALKKDKEDNGEGKKKGKKNRGTPEIAVLLGGASLADGAAGVDLGRATAGGSAPVRTFTTRNDGTGPLSIGRVTLPAGFTLIDAPASGIDKGDSTTFAVRMNTGAAGSPSGQLSITSNDADEGTFNVTLRGTIVRPTAPPPTPEPPPPPPATSGPVVSVWIPRERRSALPLADGRTDAIRFRTATVGGRAPRLTLRVANEGDATLRLGAVQLPAGFVLVEPLSSSLAPGATDEFTIALATTAVATRSGQVTFTTNDPRASVFNFAVAGSVVPPPPPPVTTPVTDLAGTTLTVNGTSGDDTIVVSGRFSSVTVTINGRPMTGSPFSSVTKVVVNAGDGSDHVDLSRLFLNATANGGPGNDQLTGTDGNDVLNGEAGNDTLDGRAGDDHLLGGDGDDLLTGGPGVDVFAGEAGVDMLNATDGIADILLDGGAGRDDARRDRVDPMAM